MVEVTKLLGLSCVPVFRTIGLFNHLRRRWDARHLARRLRPLKSVDDYTVTGSCWPTPAAHLWGGLCDLIAGRSVSLVWSRAGWCRNAI